MHGASCKSYITSVETAMAGASVVPFNTQHQWVGDVSQYRTRLGSLHPLHGVSHPCWLPNSQALFSVLRRGTVSSLGPCGACLLPGGSRLPSPPVPSSTLYCTGKPP